MQTELPRCYTPSKHFPNSVLSCKWNRSHTNTGRVLAVWQKEPRFLCRIQQVWSHSSQQLIWTTSEQETRGWGSRPETLMNNVTSIVTIMGIKRNWHDWRAAERNLRTQRADRSIRFTVSCGSPVISSTPVCCRAELSQRAPRVLLVQTGSRGWSAGPDPSARSRWNLNLQL